MGFFKFNKIPKHRVFNYIPRYYDPEKDERDAIIKQAKLNAGLLEPEDMDGSLENAKYRLNKSFRNRSIASKHKRADQKKSNIRIVLIIIILAALAYILLSFNLDFLVKFTQ